MWVPDMRCTPTKLPHTASNGFIGAHSRGRMQDAEAAVHRASASLTNRTERRRSAPMRCDWAGLGNDDAFVLGSRI